MAVLKHKALVRLSNQHDNSYKQTQWCLFEWINGWLATCRPIKYLYKHFNIEKYVKHRIGLFLCCGVNQVYSYNLFYVTLTCALRCEQTYIWFNLLNPIVNLISDAANLSQCQNVRHYNLLTTSRRPTSTMHLWIQLDLINELSNWNIAVIATDIIRTPLIFHIVASNVRIMQHKIQHAIYETLFKSF